MTATFYVGDAIETMNKLPEKSVDLILTSPPFLALRSYLPADHPDKGLEGGSQATPGAFIDWLVDVVEACDRVLAPHGSLCIELGDTYAGSGGAGGDYAENGLREGQPPFRANHERGWPLAKSLSLIPELFRFTLVYGTNPLTGRTTERWRLRNVVRWVRPNPPVGALGDKFRPATSELMVFCKSAKRYFDLDAVREPYSERFERGIEKGEKRGSLVGAPDEYAMKNFPKGMSTDHAGAPPLDWWNIPLLEGEEPCETCGGVGWFWTDAEHTEEGKAPCPACDGSGIQGATRYGPKERPAITPRSGMPKRRKAFDAQADTKRRKPGDTEGTIWVSTATAHNTYHKDGGAPPLDWWNIPPGGYEGAHYAVFPPELCIKPIKAMCPEKVCRVCGEPSRRIVEKTEEYATFRAARTFKDVMPGATARQLASAEPHGVTTSIDHHKDNGARGQLYETQGFTDCGHDDWRPGIVLDPFGGSGTTALVATGHGRDCILIDLDERNYELALQRVGPFILERAT